MTVLAQPGRSSSCRRASRRTVAALSGSTMPNSDSRPRMRLMVAVRCCTNPSFATVLKVTRALGLRLHAQAV